jgi:REP element-mobilizing transposase RayT
MARPMRIEYPDAWYHVMNRGRRSENIFLEDNDYYGFLKLLIESTAIWNVRIAGYCLMPNHYHLLVHTPDANLSRCMRHINGVYTQRFNRSHQCDGQLFRGRYKAILIDADTYLLQLLRYIHRNPLNAGLVEQLDAYQWSSHNGYLSDAKKWAWLYKDFVLSMLTEDGRQRRRAYREFIVMDDSREIKSILQKKKLPAILGSQGFVDWVKGRFYEEKIDVEMPQSKVLVPDKDKIKEVVCKAYGVEEEDLQKSIRGIFNEPRNVAIYLTRQLRRDTLDEIAREFRMKRYSSTSSAIERVKAQISEDQRFRRRVERLKTMLTKSQT